ncbi:16S rRNA (guanine(527)-N(7))-methyltransferase RsmG [Paenibacillus humicola]|uniref:16S rRNA (guanine(527)-N(7))-methyltransferase RsmG n=1 Tax=Paenibacillus humicola TaxID=3110540 RepID=UPI00237A0FAB|nr:16S rRNA (guanine(527)-N(7))-methyltransferase RsmG [Paenibacillus humicola]
MNQTEFTRLLAEKGVECGANQLQQFETYYQLLVEWNEKMNLTGITEREAVYEKHFFDSISLAFFVPMNRQSNLADIGSGAGFPSVPLKICFPHLSVTIVDSLSKRISFLKELVRSLELENVECIHGRAEDVARVPDYRDKFDLVTARAVARLSVLNEFCLPFVRPGGLFAAMKGADPDDEIDDAQKSLRELKGRLREVHRLQLPIELSDRHVVIIDKTDKTPSKYPRKAGTPLKQPL